MTLATGCLGGDRDIEVVFRVADTTGAPSPFARVSCGGECDGDSVECFVTGTVSQLDDGDFLCTIEDADALPVYLSAVAGDASVEATVYPRPTGDYTLVLWAPTVTVTEVGDELVVAWDPAPLVPGTVPDGDLEVLAWPDVARARVALDATSVAFPREDFEDFEVTFSLETEQVIDGHTHWQWVDAIDAPHTALLPASRGAACTVTRETRIATGQEPLVEEVAYDAGECPLTDGVTGAACSSSCELVEAVIDLGSEQLVRRVRVRGEGGVVEVSSDGASFTVVGAADEELPPVAARYVRVENSGRLGEISVFTQ